MLTSIYIKVKSTTNELYLKGETLNHVYYFQACIILFVLEKYEQILIHRNDPNTPTHQLFLT
jgi:hypothetical protein